MPGHASSVWNRRRRTKLCGQVVKTHLTLWTHGSKSVCVAGHLLKTECPENAHSVSVIQSSQSTLFVLNTCTHCVGGMQVVRIVTAVLYTLEICCDEKQQWQICSWRFSPSSACPVERRSDVQRASTCVLAYSYVWPAKCQPAVSKLIQKLGYCNSRAAVSSWGVLAFCRP